ncbi:MAG: C10 family peptidase [Sedimentisphaerales bacterium]|nr:C10 family peptidase [Sedimentisphaerales bacterium]
MSGLTKKQSSKKYIYKPGTSLVLAVLFISIVGAAPVDVDQAQQAAAGWLKLSPQPLATPIGNTVGTTDTYSNETGQALYHVVTLSPTGFVVVSADDQLEPIIAFSATGQYDPSPDNPLTVLLRSDLAARLAASNEEDVAAAGPSDKWVQLLAAAEEEEFAAPAGESSIDDVRVAPLTQSEWGQETEYGQYCYNYYTPYYYPSGCVATAMAQLMRYYQHPTAGIGQTLQNYSVNGVPYSAYTRGGDGYGGPYNWSQMPLDPNSNITETQRQAIGALCYDAGICAGMNYTAGGSGAGSDDARDALINIFGYSNGIFGWNNNNNIGPGLNGMINPNLDAGLPVMLGVSRPGGGHAVLADGYGYNLATLYHHLNLGWYGSDNAWYNLPDIDTGSYDYDSVDGCVYNVFISGDGEIISGRVTDMAGYPLTGATVKAKIGLTEYAQDTTDDKGIYALVYLDPNTTYNITAEKEGYLFNSQTKTTGHSEDYEATSGNVWDVNFAATNASPPIAYNGSANAFAGDTERITLLAGDEGEPDPPGSLTYIITSLPGHGKLADPNSGLEITSAPYTLLLGGNGVDYTACPYFAGEDTFTFKANDGGTPPEGGDSNVATITVDVENELSMIVDPDSNSYSYFLFETTYVDYRCQSVYLASELNGAQRITGLAVDVYIAPGQTLNYWTIRMKHTTLSSLTNPTTFWQTSGWTMCYQGTMSPTPTGWRTFTFTMPFDYDGTQNLMVDFSFNNTTYSATDGACMIYTTSATRSMILAAPDNTHGDPLTWTAYEMGGYFSAPFVPNIEIIGQVPATPIPADFENSCDVDLTDFAIFSAAWQTSSGQPNYDERCDIGVNDNMINILDLAAFCEAWLETYTY